MDRSIAVFKQRHFASDIPTTAKAYAGKRDPRGTFVYTPCIVVSLMSTAL